MAPRVELIKDLEDLPPESKAVLDEYLEKNGSGLLEVAGAVDHPWREKNTPEHEEWVTQFIKLLGHSPDLLRVWLDKDWYIARAGLIAKKDVQLAEMIGLVVAVALDCPYCIAWHSTVAQFDGAEPDLVTKLRNYDENRDAFSEMQQATFDYAREIAKDAYQVTDEEVQNLRNWFTVPEVVELTELACHMTGLSKFFTALGADIW
jgi:AhpD family alkylhydroperoxidase